MWQLQTANYVTASYLTTVLRRQLREHMQKTPQRQNGFVVSWWSAYAHLWFSQSDMHNFAATATALHCATSSTSDNELVGDTSETRQLIDWLSSVLRPLQHSIGYMGDGFYRSKDPTNSIKVLKEKL